MLRFNVSSHPRFAGKLVLWGVATCVQAAFIIGLLTNCKKDRAAVVLLLFFIFFVPSLTRRRVVVIVVVQFAHLLLGVVLLFLQVTPPSTPSSTSPSPSTSSLHLRLVLSAGLAAIGYVGAILKSKINCAVYILLQPWALALLRLKMCSSFSVFGSLVWAGEVSSILSLLSSSVICLVVYAMQRCLSSGKGSVCSRVVGSSCLIEITLLSSVSFSLVLSSLHYAMVILVGHHRIRGGVTSVCLLVWSGLVCLFLAFHWMVSQLVF